MILRIIGGCIQLQQMAHAHLPFPFPVVCLWYFLRLGQTLHWHFHKDAFVWLWLQCAMYGSRYLEWNTNLERPPVQMRGRRIFIISYAVQVPSFSVVSRLISIPGRVVFFDEMWFSVTGLVFWPSRSCRLVPIRWGALFSSVSLSRNHHLLA